MKLPTDKQLALAKAVLLEQAADWGSTTGAADLKAVVAWLSAERQSRMERQEARLAGVPVAKVRDVMKRLQGG